jgi:hypothetical protein
MIITLLRKPLDGSVAENALQHGCGAINIDATRVGTEARSYKGAGKTDKVYSESGAGMLDGRGEEMVFSVEGRWPANFILNHLEGCELKGTKKVKGAISKPSVGNKAKTSISMNNSKDGIHRVGHADEDGKEDVEDWACVDGCPVKTLDEQSGFQKSGVAGSKSRAWGVAGKGQLSSTEDGVGWKAYGSEGYGDEGGASRFFMQFKKDPEQ